MPFNTFNSVARLPKKMGGGKRKRC